MSVYVWDGEANGLPQTEGSTDTLIVLYFWEVSVCGTETAVLPQWCATGCIKLSLLELTWPRLVQLA